MIKKDYLLKQIHVLLEELKEKLSNSSTEEKKTIIEKSYNYFFNKNRYFFINNSLKYIQEELNLNEEYLTLLGELFYNDAIINNVDKKLLLNKSIETYNFINQKSDVFSFSRSERIKELNIALKEL